MKKSKIRLFALVMAVMCCMAAFSVSALAADSGCYASDETGNTEIPDAIDTLTISNENVTLDKDSATWDENAVPIDFNEEDLSGLFGLLFGTAGKELAPELTPDGNLSLIDDIYQVEGSYTDEVQNKQFITVQTKNGNYFYIVIDRSGETENVYFLNMVDEADLYALLADGDSTVPVKCTCTDKCVAGDVDTTCPVCAQNMSECTGKEPEPEKEVDETKPDAEPVEKESSSNKGIIAVVLLLVVGGGGALYWFKFRKGKPDVKGNDDLDDYDYGEEDDEEEPEYEVEEDEPEETVDDE